MINIFLFGKGNTNLSRIRHNVLSRGINPQPLGFGGVFAVFKISNQFL